MKKITFYQQHEKMDCGPTCLRIIAKYYGKKMEMQRLRALCGINREGVSLLGISRAAEKIGFRTNGIRLTLQQIHEIELPCILHWDQNHFVVLYKIRKGKYYIADPANDLIVYNEEEFKQHWISTLQMEEWKGVVLMLSPSPAFFEQEEEEKANLLDWNYILSYLSRHKKMVIQLMLGLFCGSIFQLILPFLSQSMVDIGISSKKLDFIVIVMIAQSVLTFSRMSIDFIRSWILLHMSTRINLEILTDFLIKLMKLPISYFESKMTGDIMQRISDQRRIESFLTGTTLNVAFSMFNMVLFSIVLIYYNITLFLILIISSIVYSIWVYAFLRVRKNLDIKRFDFSSKNQSNIVQLISGMQEIKMNNSEQQKRWEWEKIQARLFKYSVKTMRMGQIEITGAFFINEAKNLILTYMVVRLVVDDVLTLGAMIAVQYIIGQLNSPIEQLIGFMQQLQDAKLSLERLNEVHAMKDEEDPERSYKEGLPDDRSIRLNQVTFSYPGVGLDPVLSEINLEIPEGKTTAIVGMSGSGKTTLLKLILRYYQPEKGEIKIGQEPLDSIGFRSWRSECGVVLQDAYIFSDSIANNIAIGDDYPDMEKLNRAIQIANIQDFITELPLGLETKIGADGKGISQGQKQRIQIARAAYKNPSYIFFDEATNSLDANNEQVIMENLGDFFIGKTVVVVAHRLSTIKNADNIVVLEKGKICEQGTHEELFENRGAYYKLVKNQLHLVEQL
ncbi:peptidase domain-containing ABC transporter [Pedobacter sp. Leaf216]|uniref:peptidase domain-containing ABC transporter n=1 Tax=Pedobacter sp. Leaf216 TaxID=1735684 RepID=UPI0009E85361|nr:peptidase domain-containing ABC transporter [Pedobacter sp. Leaf216]